MDSIGKQILVLYMPASRVGDGLFWSRKVDHPFPKIPSPTLTSALKIMSVNNSGHFGTGRKQRNLLLGSHIYLLSSTS